MAQWIECWPVNQRVAGSISSQGTFLSCGPGPQWGVPKRQPHIDVSLPFFLPPFPSIKINIINTIFLKNQILHLHWTPVSSFHIQANPKLPVMVTCKTYFWYSL